MKRNQDRQRPSNFIGHGFNPSIAHHSRVQAPYAVITTDTTPVPRVWGMRWLRQQKYPPDCKPRVRISRLTVGLVAVGVVLTACAGTATSFSTNSSHASVSVEPLALSFQEQEFVDRLRLKDSDGVWVGVDDSQVAELAAGFCRIADQVADLSEQEYSGVDQGDRGQYFIGGIMGPDTPPATLIRNGQLLGALVIDDPTMCSKAALGVLIDAMDWVFENLG